MPLTIALPYQQECGPPLSFWYDNFSQLKIARNISEIFILLRTITQQLDFEYCAYQVQGNSNTGKPFKIAQDTFPGVWFGSYIDSIEMNADPIFDEASSTCLPIKWSRRHLRRRRFLYRTAVKMGLRHGISFPFRGPNGTLSLFSIARNFSSISEDEVVALTVKLYPILAMAHDIFLAQSVVNRGGNTEATLTSREKQILIQASEGNTSGEIARKLMVTERTVNFHIENVRRKLNVKNRAHAIARANAIGLIPC